MNHHIRILTAAIVALAATNSICGANPSERLRGTVENVNDLYSKQLDWNARTDLEQAVINADKLVRQVVFQHLQKTRTLLEIMDLTKDTISWFDWSQGVTSEELTRVMLQGDKKLHINYLMYKGDRGSELYVMANSFWTGRARVTPSIYVVRVEHQTAKMAELQGCGPDLNGAIYTPLSGIESPPCLLGFGNLNADTPSILVLNGPRGNGRFVTCFEFREQGGNWAGKPVWEGSDVTWFTYVLREHTLLYGDC